MEGIRRLNERESPRMTNIGAGLCLFFFFVAGYVAWKSDFNSVVFWWSIVVAAFFGLSLAYIMKVKLK